MNNVQVPLTLRLWRTDGCHELLASVGFDLLGVGKEEVMLRSGKINSRRALQCLIQALYALSGEMNLHSLLQSLVETMTGGRWLVDRRRVVNGYSLLY